MPPDHDDAGDALREHDSDREAILLRRRQLLALALGASALSTGCTSIVGPCLSRIPSDAGTDASE